MLRICVVFADFGIRLGFVGVSEIESERVLFDSMGVQCRFVLVYRTCSDFYLWQSNKLGCAVYLSLVLLLFC